jgi:hypothetical protein
MAASQLLQRQEAEAGARADRQTQAGTRSPHEASGGRTHGSREASLTATQGRPDATGTQKGSRAAGSVDVDSGGQRSPARGAEAAEARPAALAQLAMTEYATE